MDNVGCRGTESRLIDCSYDSGTTDCSHREDAGVTCQPATSSGFYLHSCFINLHNIHCYADVNCTNGDVRLMGGSNPMEGRVEICYYNQWGTVCDDSWSTYDARVVCGQLGYSSASLLYKLLAAVYVRTIIMMIIIVGATAYTGARFGAGAGPIVMDDVLCTSTENRLIECPFTFNHDCVHSEDAGVRCIISTTGIIVS